MSAPQGENGRGRRAELARRLHDASLRRRVEEPFAPLLQYSLFERRQRRCVQVSSAVNEDNL